MQGKKEILRLKNSVSFAFLLHQEKVNMMRCKIKPSLSFLMITLASGIVPIKVPPGRSKADMFAKARRARASVDQE